MQTELMAKTSSNGHHTGLIVGGSEFLSIDIMITRVKLLREALEKKLLVEFEDYDLIPGTPKKSLLLPGAEKLAQLFRLRPRYKHERTFHPNGHLTVTSMCQLIHIESRLIYSEASGMCSTMERKYRYRMDKRSCPHCQQQTIFKSKYEGEGFYCWVDKGGCGRKFPVNDPTIINQSVGIVENPDIADQFNTVIKMGDKRAFTSAVKMAVAGSGMFTVDQEEKRKKKAAQANQPTQAAQQPRPAPERQERGIPDRQATPPPQRSPQASPRQEVPKGVVSPKCPKCGGVNTMPSNFGPGYHCKTLRAGMKCGHNWEEPGDKMPTDGVAPNNNFKEEEIPF